MKNHNKSDPRQLLRLERLQRQWSQQELADRLGTTVVSINRWERGATSPTPYFRLKLCALFGKSADELGLLPGEVVGNTVTSSLEPVNKTVSPIPPSTRIASQYWYLPFQRNPFFTGRDVLLTHLHTRLHASNIRVHALSGLGGIGKTQTAIEYAYRFRGTYSAVLWMRAETTEVFNADCIDLTKRFELFMQDRQQESIEIFRQWLMERQNWLLILDNVDDMSLVERFLPSFLNGYVLITTRAQAVGPLVEHIYLQQMTLEESTMLLLRRSKLSTIDTNIQLKAMPQHFVKTGMAITELLAGLPLAIDQAGAYIEETGCSLEEYLDRYHQYRLALLDRRGAHTMEHPASVIATISLCVERVRQRNPAALELLLCCAFLHPDAIYEEILRTGASALGPSLTEVVSQPLLFDDALATLRAVSLLYRNTKNKQLTLHRLIQVILRESLTRPVQRLWAERTIKVIDLAFPQVESVDTIQQCERLLPQVFTCADLIIQWQCTFYEAAHLLHKAGSYVLFCGQYARAEQFLQDALTLYRQNEETSVAPIASVLASLGTIYEAQGRYNQAELAYQQALQLREKILSHDHPDIIEILTYIGRIELCQAHYEIASRVLARAFSYQDIHLSQFHPHLSITLYLLATLYHQQGNYTHAEDALQQLVFICQQNLGDTHPSTIESLSKLALLYYIHGQYQQAKDLHQQTIEILSTGAYTSYQTVPSLRSLGLMYCLQGQYDQAETLLRQALAICQRTFGNAHVETAESLKHLAIMYRMTRRYEQAVDTLTKACMLFTDIFGTSHPETAEALRSLGIIYGLQSKYVQAEEVLQQSVSIFSTLFNPFHPDTTESCRALGVIYSLRGEYTQSEALLQQTLHIQEQSLGMKHPLVTNTLYSLATLYLEQRQYDQARTLGLQALQIREQFLGPEHPEVQELHTFLENLSITHEM